MEKMLINTATTKDNKILSAFYHMQSHNIINILFIMLIQTLNHMITNVTLNCVAIVARPPCTLRHYLYGQILFFCL